MAVVRWAQKTDVPVVFQLAKELAEFADAKSSFQATEESFVDAFFGDSPAAFCHVVETLIDGRPTVIGYVAWYATFSTWLGQQGAWVDDLYVRSDFRGHGFGTALLDAVRNECVERNYGRLEWVSHNWNGSAIRFYKGYGAVPKEEFTIFRLNSKTLNEAQQSSIDLSPEVHDTRLTASAEH